MIQHYFKQFELFTDEELVHIESLFVQQIINKDDFFIKEGEMCKHIAFIESGILRSFYITDDGKDTTYCFRFPNETAASYSSFITGKGSPENIQAVSNAVVYLIKKETIEQLTNTQPKWVLFLKIVAEQEYLELEKRFFQLQRESATNRYQYLLNHQAHYIQDIPLQYLASYLGITQRHLSRIRKAITF